MASKLFRLWKILPVCYFQHSKIAKLSHQKDNTHQVKFTLPKGFLWKKILSFFCTSNPWMNIRSHIKLIKIIPKKVDTKKIFFHEQKKTEEDAEEERNSFMHGNMYSENLYIVYTHRMKEYGKMGHQDSFLFFSRSHYPRHRGWLRHENDRV